MEKSATAGDAGLDAQVQVLDEVAWLPVAAWTHSAQGCVEVTTQTVN